ncbi:TetR/AcrR family transcriptional regulator [Cellulomonas hominis]
MKRPMDTTHTSYTDNDTAAAAAPPAESPRSSARERLVAAATRLFYAEGIHAVGVDRLIDAAGVTRATMYKQFAGKEGLVLAYLEAQDAQIRAIFDGASGALHGAGLLDAVLDGIAEDVREHHTRGCPFINAAAEYPDATGAVRLLIARHRDWFRAALEQVAAQAGLIRPDQVAASLVLLRDSALVGGYLDGDDLVEPAFLRTARAAIAAHRPADPA